MKNLLTIILVNLIQVLPITFLIAGITLLLPFQLTAGQVIVFSLVESTLIYLMVCHILTMKRR